MPLDPIAQQLVDDAAASGRPNAHQLPVGEARRNFEDAFAALAGPELHAVVDHTVPTRDGETIRARLYLPDGSPDLPLTVYLHGGGWLLGSIDSHDVTTRKLALASGSAVLSVDYRRGPDSRFPTAVEDTLDALAWAKGLPVDTARIAVAGDSAGGNLAAATTLSPEAPPLVHQLLVYPVTTCDLDRGFDPAYEKVMLWRDELQWHQDNYLPSSAAATDPRVDVLAAVRPGLPPATVLLAECDPIRPQGILYAEALEAAGVPVLVHETPGMVHGFFGLDEVFPVAADAMALAGGRLAAAFAAVPR